MDPEYLVGVVMGILGIGALYLDYRRRSDDNTITLALVERVAVVEVKIDALARELERVTDDSTDGDGEG